MNNLPYTHLQFLDTTPSHYVYLASDLYQNFNNTNGTLSLYAGLYNNYKSYCQLGKIPTYREIVAQWLLTLSDTDRKTLRQKAKEDHAYFSAIINNKSIEDKGPYLANQYTFTLLLLDIIDGLKKNSSINNMNEIDFSSTKRSS